MGVQCVRPDCDQVAVTKLAADFNRRVGWLRDDTAPDSVHDYRLCARHADRLSLPVNWVLHDERGRRLQSVPDDSGGPADPADAEPAGQSPASFDPAAAVGETTPLLSRAFRAAAPGPARPAEGDAVLR